MSNFNKVILLGNLTRDIELRYSPKGTPIGRGSLAVNRKWKSDDGESREEVLFCDIDFFGKSAETVAQYTQKGSQLLVEGRLKLSQWEDKESGQKRQKLSVVAESFQFVGSKASEDGESGQASSGQSKRGKSSAATKEQGSDDSPESDDVPF